MFEDFTSVYIICVLPACSGVELCIRQTEIIAWLGKTGVSTTNCYSSCNSPSSLGKQCWGLFEWLFIRSAEIQNLLWNMTRKIFCMMFPLQNLMYHICQTRRHLSYSASHSFEFYILSLDEDKFEVSHLLVFLSESTYEDKDPLWTANVSEATDRKTGK